MISKDRSPFTPDSPVPVEYFVGRRSLIEEIRRHVKQTASGKHQHVFLVGDRGIGKSSLGAFLRALAGTEENLLGIHVFLSNARTLEEMVRLILEELLKESREQTWFDSIKGLFGRYIEKVGLFGVSVSFAPPSEDLTQLVSQFPEAVNNVLKSLHDRKKGLFIILDNINGLADNRDFADWYKSFVDAISVKYGDFPLFVMVIGLPDQRAALSKLQPSLMRIFRIFEIDKLEDEEVVDFLKKAFSSAERKVWETAMNTMKFFSGGLPAMMQEIGDATYWADEDGTISDWDAKKGVYAAADSVGKKYVDPKVYEKVRSKSYRSILSKLGDFDISLSQVFLKREVEARLNPDERKVFHNFLRKFRQLGIIEHCAEKGRGVYRFVNALYPVYIAAESAKSKKGIWKNGI